MARSSLLQGKVALVTGASRNIGAGVAKCLADHGAMVAVNYLQNRDLADQVVNDIRSAGGQAIACRADVTDPAQVAQMVREITATWGRLDILVNNARPLPTTRESYLDMALDQLEARVTAELRAVDICSRSVFPLMKERGWGRIVNISSTAGRQAGANTVPYRVAKAAMEALSKAIAMEFAPYGITVNIIAPGWVITDRIGTLLTPETLERLRAETPLGRLASPEDIGGAVAVLCFDDARFITGQYIYVSGGTVMP